MKRSVGFGIKFLMYKDLSDVQVLYFSYSTVQNTIMFETSLLRAFIAIFDIRTFPNDFNLHRNLST